MTVQTTALQTAAISAAIALFAYGGDVLAQTANQPGSARNPTLPSGPTTSAPPTAGCIAIVADTAELAAMYSAQIARRAAPTVGTRIVTDRRTDASESRNDMVVAAEVLAEWRRRLPIEQPEVSVLSVISAQSGCGSVIIATVGQASPSWRARRFRAEGNAVDAIVDAPYWALPDVDALCEQGTTHPLQPAPETTTSLSVRAETVATAAPATGGPGALVGAADAPRAQGVAARPPAPRQSDPRVAPTPAAAGGSPWPWVAAGAAAAVLVGGFFLVQSLGPSSPVVHVTGPGTGP
jgi:hypothetical protein